MRREPTQPGRSVPGSATVCRSAGLVSGDDGRGWFRTSDLSRVKRWAPRAVRAAGIPIAKRNAPPSPARTYSARITRDYARLSGTLAESVTFCPRSSGVKRSGFVGTERWRAAESSWVCRSVFRPHTSPARRPKLPNQRTSPSLLITTDARRGGRAVAEVLAGVRIPEYGHPHQVRRCAVAKSFRYDRMSRRIASYTAAAAQVTPSFA